MQYLEDDMDNLLREAAENYPLKVTGADFSKVQAELPGNPAAAAKPVRNKKWWSLLLLLLIPFVCTVLKNYNNNSDSQSMHVAAVSEKIPAAQTPVQLKADVHNNKANNTRASQQSQPDVVQNIKVNLSAASAIIQNGPAEVRMNIQDVKTGHAGTVKFSKAKAATHISFGSSDITTGIPDATNTVINNTKNIRTLKDQTASNATPPVTSDMNEQKTGIGITDKKKETAIIKVQPKTAEDTKTETASNTNSKQQKNKNLQQPKIYFNLLGGPDASRVKTENVKNIGFSLGAGLGYDINKHLAVEAAALYSDKHYKSAYKDFNNSKTNWSSYDIIQELQGECKMIEIPVTLRYNIGTTRGHRFFAAAGLSSYIMKKESYTYDYTYTTYPGARVYNTSKSYSNSSKNWLSVLQLSAGWQKNIGKKISVRLQPYYNVPLSGVGIGSLHISGAGVLAGLSIPIK